MQPPRNLEEIPHRESYLIPHRTYRTYIWFDKYILTKVAQKRWMHSGGSVHAPKMPAEGGMISCKATRREGNNCATACACREHARTSDDLSQTSEPRAAHDHSNDQVGTIGSKASCRSTSNKKRLELQAHCPQLWSVTTEKVGSRHGLRKISVTTNEEKEVALWCSLQETWRQFLTGNHTRFLTGLIGLISGSINTSLQSQSPSRSSSQSSSARRRYG